MELLTNPEAALALPSSSIPQCKTALQKNSDFYSHTYGQNQNRKNIYKKENVESFKSTNTITIPNLFGCNEKELVNDTKYSDNREFNEDLKEYTTQVSYGIHSPSPLSVCTSHSHYENIQKQLQSSLYDCYNCYNIIYNNKENRNIFNDYITEDLENFSNNRFCKSSNHAIVSTTCSFAPDVPVSYIAYSTNDFSKHTHPAYFHQPLDCISYYDINTQPNQVPYFNPSESGKDLGADPIEKNTILEFHNRVRQNLSPTTIIDQQNVEVAYQTHSTATTPPSLTFMPVSKRTIFSPQQLEGLEEKFLQQSFLSKAERSMIGEKLGLTERQIMIWFQNRRSRLKKKGPQDKAYVIKKKQDMELVKRLCQKRVENRVV